MSASGERNVKHGDVFDDGDGYFVIQLQTSEGVWLRSYINKTSGTAFLSDALRTKAFVGKDYVYKFNIMDVISNAMTAIA
jgi:hypothetical protein